jgi:caffeoyl-CoA O-methyltransferase
MPYKSLLQSEAVAKYVNVEMVRETDVQARLRSETTALPAGGMQISADQGALLGLLARLAGTRKALEVGVFTGYSALCVAATLPADGTLVACDVSEEWTRVARRYWKEAGVADKIDLRIAPAERTLRSLIDGGESESFDFAFIDADKAAYDAYYEFALRLVRAGGLIVLDNMLRGGRVAEASSHDPETAAIRELNSKVRDDGRVDATLVAVGDGLMLARKK